MMVWLTNATESFANVIRSLLSLSLPSGPSRPIMPYQWSKINSLSELVDGYLISLSLFHFSFRIGQRSPGLGTQGSFRKWHFLRKYWMGRKRYDSGASRLWSVISPVHTGLHFQAIFGRWYPCFEGAHIRGGPNESLALHRLRGQWFTDAQFFLCSSTYVTSFPLNPTDGI